MAYFGPETYLPLASIVAGGVGVLLTFWRRFVGFVRHLGGKLFHRRGGPGHRPPEMPPPIAP